MKAKIAALLGFAAGNIRVSQAMDDILAIS
jgi:hypothetical protein